MADPFERDVMKTNAAMGVEIARLRAENLGLKDALRMLGREDLVAAAEKGVMEAEARIAQLDAKARAQHARAQIR